MCQQGTQARGAPRTEKGHAVAGQGQSLDGQGGLGGQWGGSSGWAWACHRWQAGAPPEVWGSKAGPMCIRKTIATTIWPSESCRTSSQDTFYSRRACFSEVLGKVQDTGRSETQGNSLKCAFHFLRVKNAGWDHFPPSQACRPISTKGWSQPPPPGSQQCDSVSSLGRWVGSHREDA